MPLDPQAQAVLDVLAAGGGEPVEEATLEESRRGHYVWLDLAGEPEDVARIDHRFVVGPTADLPVRVYTPEGEGPFPGIVYFHGSGWVVGNIETADTGTRALANRTGCVVVAVNYQKAPEHPFPVPLDDCYAATQWVVDNAESLGIDPARIGVVGDSAGGNLAAAVCLKARDEGGPRLAFQVLVYPALDRRFDLPSMVENAEGYLLTSANMRWFWDQYLPDEEAAADPLACPMRAASLAGLPPAIVLTAEYDPLRDDGELYAAALEDAGVPVVLRRYDEQLHGFLWMSRYVDASRRLLDDIGDDVRRVLAQ